MAEEIGVRIEPGSLRRLVQASRTWDAVSKREMRAKLRAAVLPAAAAARSEVLGSVPPSIARASGHATMGKLRAGLAAGVSVSIRTGRENAAGAVSGEGVRVTASSKKLDAEQEPMVKAYMSRVFRHPVFGDTSNWADQSGKNWFYKPLRADKYRYQAAMVAAIEEASQAIARDA